MPLRSVTSTRMDCPISRPLRAAAGALNLPAAASYMITGAAMAVSVLLNEGNRTH